MPALIWSVLRKPPHRRVNGALLRPPCTCAKCSFVVNLFDFGIRHEWCAVRMGTPMQWKYTTGEMRRTTRRLMGSGFWAIWCLCCSPLNNTKYTWTTFFPFTWSPDEIGQPGDVSNRDLWDTRNLSSTIVLNGSSLKSLNDVRWEDLSTSETGRWSMHADRTTMQSACLNHLSRELVGIMKRSTRCSNKQADIPIPRLLLHSAAFKRLMSESFSTGDAVASRVLHHKQFCRGLKAYKLKCTWKILEFVLQIFTKRNKQMQWEFPQITAEELEFRNSTPCS